MATTGVYGGEPLFGEHLIVNGIKGDAGRIITFFVGGVIAAGTAVYPPALPPALSLWSCPEWLSLRT